MCVDHVILWVFKEKSSLHSENPKHHLPVRWIGYNIIVQQEAQSCRQYWLKSNQCEN